jgi:hypothetical protein
MTAVVAAALSMTLALVLYGAAFGLARSHYRIHISFAATAFILDLYATYLMETRQLVASEYSTALLGTHIGVSMLALIGFVLVALFGVLKKRNIHLKLLKWIFIPTWLASYVTGMILIFG